MPYIDVTCEHCCARFDDMSTSDIENTFFGCNFCGNEMCPKCEFDTKEGLHEECVSKMHEEWEKASNEGDL